MPPGADPPPRTPESARQQVRLRRFLLASAFSVLYLVVLGVFRFHDGIDRATLADAFLSSEEANRRQVERFYTVYLGRPPEQAGVQGWLEALRTRRATPAQVALAFLTSDEFFARAAVR